MLEFEKKRSVRNKRELAYREKFSILASSEQQCVGGGYFTDWNEMERNQGIKHATELDLTELR